MLKVILCNSRMTESEDTSHLLSVTFDIYVCVCVCVGTHVSAGTQACGGQRTTSGCTPTFFLFCAGAHKRVCKGQRAAMGILLSFCPSYSLRPANPASHLSLPPSPVLGLYMGLQMYTTPGFLCGCGRSKVKFSAYMMDTLSLNFLSPLTRPSLCQVG